METEAIVREIRERLAPLALEAVWLVGSRARGAGEDSDVDLIVVQETRDRFPVRQRKILERLKNSYALDLFVYTPEEVERMQAEGNRFLLHAMEGARRIL